MPTPIRLLALAAAILTGCIANGPDLESDGESFAPLPLGEWDLYQENTMLGGMEVRLVQRPTGSELFARVEFDGLTELGVKTLTEQSGFYVQGNGQILAATSVGASPSARNFIDALTDFTQAWDPHCSDCPGRSIYDPPVIVPIISSCASAIVPVLECRSNPASTTPCNVPTLSTCLGALWSAERSRSSWIPRPVPLAHDGSGAHDPVTLVAGAPRVWTGRLQPGERRRLWIAVPQKYDDSLDISIGAVSGEATAVLTPAARVVPLFSLSSARAPYNNSGSVMTGNQETGPWWVDVQGAGSTEVEYELELEAHSWVRVRR